MSILVYSDIVEKNEWIPKVMGLGKGDSCLII